MFLDYAEDQAQRRKQIFLKDWKTKLDDFLRFNERGVLPSAGRVSRDAADTKAEQEYEQFSASRRVAIEMEAEQDALRELEDTARKLPKLKKPKKRKDTDGDAQP